MKRSNRILMLRRETLRRLTPLHQGDLAQVVGGGATSKKPGLQAAGGTEEGNEDTLGATSLYC